MKLPQLKYVSNGKDNEAFPNWNERFKAGCAFTMCPSNALNQKFVLHCMNFQSQLNIFPDFTNF